MARLSDKRKRLVDAAKNLIHRKGYYQTTLADIARESEVPLGNVYYYFKTKEDIAYEVIVQQHQWLADNFQKWEMDSDPILRINRLLESYLSIKEAVAAYGCPVGSLCQELGKTPSSLTEEADKNMGIQLAWVSQQFRQLGRSNAEDLAMQFMASLQGCLVLANVMNDPAVIERQFKRLRGWLLKI